MKIQRVISDYRVHSSEIKAQAEQALEELFERYGEEGKYFNKPLTVIIELIDEEVNEANLLKGVEE